MFLRRSLAHISYMYMIFYIWGSCPPPPQYQKAGYATATERVHDSQPKQAVESTRQEVRNTDYQIIGLMVEKEHQKHYSGCF